MTRHIFMCMRLSTLFVMVFALGCVNVSASSTSGALNQVNETRDLNPSAVRDQSATIEAPEGVEIDADLIDPPPVYYDECTCEYVGWHENGLICVGIECTDECSAEISSCNERRRACVPDV